MKVIDLLNKIANGEEGDLTTYFIFEKEKFNFYQFSKEYAIDINSLNWEIELEEDKKIEKFELPKFINEGENTTDSQIWNLNINLCYTRDKINEIIDYLEENKK